MKVKLLLLFLSLTLSSYTADGNIDTIVYEVETLQKTIRNETLGVNRSGSETLKNKYDKGGRAISIPAGNAGNTSSQATGIPAGKKNTSNWLFSILLSLPLFAVAGRLFFKKRFTIITTGTTVSPEFNLEDSSDYGMVSTDAVKDNEKSKQITRVKDFMVTEQPYLDPELTIKTMANQLDMEVRELSLLLNNSFQQNFYDFLNLYRIEKAKELLKDPINKKLTILEILYSVGFNSKSSFNTSFKKLSGLTPTQYRQKFIK